ncbi:MAG: molybdopterin molybdotransferase MoeA [Bacteroidales bacterium]|nr:molybdopterin molybdotransferase MoeA [Bacteroidales bacterium]
MIKLEEALKILDMLPAGKPSAERVPLEDATGRVLAEDVFADTDFPSFDKSAMDGYAIRSDDIDKELKVIEFIPAGKKPGKEITTGCCSRIMTGAMVPAGADMVVRQEDVVTKDESTIAVVNKNSKGNILFRGEDVKSGALLLEAGIEIGPAHIGLLASAGNVSPLVYAKPVVRVLSSGDELVPPSEKPLPPGIRNSNSAQLVALANRAGAVAVDAGIVADDPDAIFQKVQDALTASDLVIMTGGASVGDLDFTGQVFNRLGARLHFEKLAIQPGKPALFANVENKCLFGLSGNPVSSLVQFHLLVRPVLRRMTGLPGTEKRFKLPLTADRKRKRAERLLFFPVRITENMQAEPLEYHGSAHLHAYHKADALAEFPIGMNVLNEGTYVNVRPI